MAGVWRRVSRLDDPIVTLEEAKRQTNVDFTDDDAFLLALCGVVTQFLDLGGGVTRRALLTQSWEFTAAGPSCAGDVLGARHYGAPQTLGFLLEASPFQAVTKFERQQSGVYSEIDAADYVTRPLAADATWLRMKDGVAWPDVDNDEASFRVTVRLGYGDTPVSVPAPLRQAALMLLGHLYQNRESVTGVTMADVPMGFDALIAPYRLLDL